MNLVFDSLGTLFRLTPLHDRLGEEPTEAWFERILHSAAFVLTNGGREGGERLLEHAHLQRLVERVFGVDEVQAYKPDPRPYRHADALETATRP